MGKYLYLYLMLTAFTSTIAKEIELPLCPTNVQFFPQNLPMHCRMPTNADLSVMSAALQYPTLSPFQPPFYQSPPPDNQPKPIPVPIPPGIPSPLPLPGPVPMSMPMMPLSGPAHKLPVIVMPFYSPDPSFKKSPNQIPVPKEKRRKRFHKRPYYSAYTDSDTSTDSDRDTLSDTSSETSSDTSRDSSSERSWWNGWKKGWRRNARRFNRKHKSKKRKHQKDLLTPILQYITNDGYVIFEKKISKGEAKDWLKDIKNKDRNHIAEKEIEDLNKNEQLDHNNDVEVIMNTDKSKEETTEEITTTTTQILPVRRHHRRKPNLLIEKSMKMPERFL